MQNTSGPPRVKICGLTNLADAQAAAQSGADYLGFVFIERSARYVTAAELTAWWGELPKLATRVALFQNATSATVESVLNQLQVDVLQFHGSESPEFCSQFGLPYWKSIGFPLGGSAIGESFMDAAERYVEAQALLIDSVTVDASGRKVSGGTGKQFDWALWPTWYKDRLVLAGGLQPANIAAAVQALKPWAVDVSSGVEASAGKKDPQKLEEFCTAVHYRSSS